jgi:hypothetical protein
MLDIKKRLIAICDSRFYTLFLKALQDIYEAKYRANASSTVPS